MAANLSNTAQAADALAKIDRRVWCVDEPVRAHLCASGMLPQSDENDELNALGRSRGATHQAAVLMHKVRSYR